MIKQEQLAGFIVISIIILAFLSWAFLPSGHSAREEEPCTPDYMGGCN